MWPTVNVNTTITTVIYKLTLDIIIILHGVIADLTVVVTFALKIDYCLSLPSN